MPKNNLISLQERLSGDLIEPEFLAIRQNTLTVKALKDNLRACATSEDLRVWQDIADLILKDHIDRANDLMKSFARTFDLEYKPVK